MADPTPNEEFARLFALNHRRIFAYVRSLVPHHADAEEVFQETCVVLWSNFADYDRGREFAPWALGVAHNQVRTWRHQMRRKDKITFSDKLLKNMAEDEAAMEGVLERQTEFLEWCLKKLRPADRELIQQFYQSEQTAKALAEQLDRPPNTIYKALGRIRGSLFECVQRRMAAEEESRS